MFGKINNTAVEELGLDLDNVSSDVSGLDSSMEAYEVGIDVDDGSDHSVKMDLNDVIPDSFIDDNLGNDTDINFDNIVPLDNVNTNRDEEDVDEDVIFNELRKKTSSTKSSVVENYHIVSFNATIIKPVKGSIVDKSLSINSDAFMDVESIPDLQDTLSIGLTNTEFNTIGDAPIIGSWNEEKVLFKFVAHFTLRGDDTQYVNLITGYSDDWDVSSKRLSALADICFTTSQVLKLDDGGLMVPLSHDRMVSTNELVGLDSSVNFVDSFFIASNVIPQDDGFRKLKNIQTTSTLSVENSPSFDIINDYVLSKGLPDVKHFASLPTKTRASVINKVIQKTFWNSLSEHDEDDNIFNMNMDSEVIIKIKFKNILALIEDKSCIQVIDKESFDELLGDLFQDDNNAIKDLIGEGDEFNDSNKLHLHALKIIEVFKKAMTRAVLLEAVIQMRIENCTPIVNVINFNCVHTEVTRESLNKINRMFRSISTDLDPFLEEMDGLIVHGRISMNGLTNRLFLEQNGEVKNYESVSIPSFTETVGTSFSTDDSVDNLDDVISSAISTAQTLDI